jgi:hypothetical protein
MTVASSQDPDSDKPADDVTRWAPRKHARGSGDTPWKVDTGPARDPVHPGRMASQQDESWSSFHPVPLAEPVIFPVPPSSTGVVSKIVLAALVGAGGTFALGNLAAPQSWWLWLTEAVSHSGPSTSRVPPPAPPAREPAAVAMPRLVVKADQARVNETISLDIGIQGRASGDVSLLIMGLPDGTTLSAGRAVAPNGWRISAADLTAADLASVHVRPPQRFAGVMDLAVELLVAETVADRRGLRLEWLPAAAPAPLAAEAQQAAGAAPATSAVPADPTVQPAPDAQSPQVTQPAPLGEAAAVVQPGSPGLDPDTIAMLVRRGEALIDNGDISAARLVLERAADAGDARAALLMGATYDPDALSKLFARGVAPDVAKARSWYRQAAERGSAEAVRRLAGAVGHTAR